MAAKLFGIGAIVLAFWIGSEIYSYGVDGAFGGLFRSSPDEIAERIEKKKRITDEAQRALTIGQERANRLLGQ